MVVAALMARNINVSTAVPGGPIFLSAAVVRLDVWTSAKESSSGPRLDMADTRLPVSRLGYLDERRRALQRWADHVEQLVSGKKPTTVVKLRKRPEN